MSVDTTTEAPKTPWWSMEPDAVASELSTSPDGLTGSEAASRQAKYGLNQLTATAGKRKAIIVLGHVPSEQAGMEECARWLKGFVKEVPVEFIPTAEPFWTPK